MINADPDAWYGLTPVARDAWGHENFDYVADALHDPLTVRSMLEDYRAGIGVDADHDRATRREHGKISRPMLVAWSVRDELEQLHANPADIWRSVENTEVHPRQHTSSSSHRPWPTRTRTKLRPPWTRSPGHAHEPAAPYDSHFTRLGQG